MQFSGNELQIDLQGRFMQTSMTKILTWCIKVFKMINIYLGKVQQNYLSHSIWFPFIFSNDEIVWW